ncbi:MAG TPA: tRNA dihydrouridine(20/20a) synthase DusA [Pseudomonadales bacterium]|nr:tRNA dihydrouridine(20/20a) synthase DusA [Pseudomonadales bacterium]
MHDELHSPTAADEPLIDGPRGSAPHGSGPLGARGVHRLCVAPMMDWTDRHCRAFHRRFGAELVLYTEMVTARALLHGDAAGLLAHDRDEHPLALQLGGAEPEELAAAARLGADAGYDEINLNVGCPSDRVASGSFGAALMAEPERVAACVAAMRASVTIPVTVKCRLGIDGAGCTGLDTDAHLHHFVDTVAAAGCTLFIVHARKAVLGGLSPKENREVPPLQYERVRALAERNPQLEIVLNGGLTDAGACRDALAWADGVMIGREAWHNPMALATMRAALADHAMADQAVTDDAPVDPLVLLQAHLPYVRAQLEAGQPLGRLVRPLLGLFHGRPGARAFRRHLSEQAHRPGAGIDVLLNAMAPLLERTRHAA